MTLNWDTDAITEEVRQAAGRGVISATELIKEKAVKKILSDAKTGRLYRRRGVTHQASAPGEAPASDTGRLVQSAHTEFDEKTITGSTVFSTAYAAALEFGRNDGSILPRPYARPALIEARDEVEDGITIAIKSVLNES